MSAANGFLLGCFLSFAFRGPLIELIVTRSRSRFRIPVGGILHRPMGVPTQTHSRRCLRDKRIQTLWVLLQNRSSATRWIRHGFAHILHFNIRILILGVGFLLLLGIRNSRNGDRRAAGNRMHKGIWRNEFRRATSPIPTRGKHPR